MREKCQKCAKPATYHITDIEKGKPREHHFCDEHARQHLNPPEESPSLPMGDLAVELIKGQVASREPSASDNDCIKSINSCWHSCIVDGCEAESRPLQPAPA